MSTKTTKADITKATAANPLLAAESYGTEADFDDTIAKNRALPLLDPDLIPARPHGFAPTDPKVRLRRLRRVADEHRAEGHDALVEASKVDLRGILGKRAPDPTPPEALHDGATACARMERWLGHRERRRAVTGSRPAS